jgi:transposase
MVGNRIRVLIEFKKNEKEGISKRAVADSVGVNHNSVQKWRRLYTTGGIELLMSCMKRDGRPAHFSKEEHSKIEAKLNNPKNGLRGYVELHQWVEKEFEKEILYNTLMKYAVREFGSKIKVARKSHVKKDKKAVEVFKKTSVKNAKK